MEARMVDRSDSHNRLVYTVSRKRPRIAVALAAAALAAVPITLGTRATDASNTSIPIQCQGFGGQGAGGFISSLVQSCEKSVQSLVASPPAP
jgi:hypothetical protein